MFSLWCMDWAGSLYANRFDFFLCISVLRVASGPRVKLASCKSALNPPVGCSTDRSKAVVPMLVLLFVALWFILRGDFLYVVPCVILFLCFSVLLALRLPRLGRRELILVLFVRLFGLCLFGFVGFLFLLGSGNGCGLWLWHSLDFSLTIFHSLVLCGYSAGRFVVCLTLCHFVLVFFSPFSIAITSLGEERANLGAFRMFDWFVLVWICRFPLPLDVWEGLRFVIVALPGLFCYLFLWLWHSLDFSLTFFGDQK